MSLYRITAKILENLPGQKYLGHYSTLPIFFVFGAALEFVMIHWTPNGTNFYQTYKKNQAIKIVDHEIAYRKFIESRNT